MESSIKSATGGGEIDNAKLFHVLNGRTAAELRTWLKNQKGGNYLGVRKPMMISKIIEIVRERL